LRHCDGSFTRAYHVELEPSVFCDDLILENRLKQMQLARVPAADTLAEDILTTLVNEVYRNEAPRNRRGFPKHEPRLSHLIDYLTMWPFKGAALDRAEELKLALDQFRDHSFLDSPTHPDFSGDSSLDVYELDSLERFPERVRWSSAISRLLSSGHSRPTRMNETPALASKLSNLTGRSFR
jgi:hypothetical protein